MAKRILGAVRTILWGIAAAAGIAACGGGGGSSASAGFTGNGAASPAGTGVPAAAPASAAPTVSNAPPVISGTPVTQARAGADYEFKPVATDPDADPLRFSASNLPAWASLDAATGRLFGRPQANDKGVHGPITLTVTDGLHVVALPAFEVSVDPARATGSIKLSWRVPESNEDGSPIDVPPRFRIHYGRSSQAYDMAVTLPEPGARRHELGDLESGTWYLAMSTVNDEGLESKLSPEMVARVN